MSEIEKMYKNAGINATAKTKEVRHNLFECGLFYPDFTAEKQLKLIKLLGKRARISLEIDFDNETNFYSDYNIIDGWFEYHSDGVTFEKALAQIINNLWQSLTEEEKEQIREILK